MLPCLLCYSPSNIIVDFLIDSVVILVMISLKTPAAVLLLLLLFSIFVVLFFKVLLFKFYPCVYACAILCHLVLL